MTTILIVPSDDANPRRLPIGALRTCGSKLSRARFVSRVLTTKYQWDGRAGKERGRDAEP